MKLIIYIVIIKEYSHFYYRGFEQVLSHEGNDIEEVFCLFFEVCLNFVLTQPLSTFILSPKTSRSQSWILPLWYQWLQEQKHGIKFSGLAM